MNSTSQPFRSAHDRCDSRELQRPRTNHAPYTSSNQEPRHANTSRLDLAVLPFVRPGLARSNVEGSLERRHETFEAWAKGPVHTSLGQRPRSWAQRNPERHGVDSFLRHRARRRDEWRIP